MVLNLNRIVWDMRCGSVLLVCLLTACVQPAPQTEVMPKVIQPESVSAVLSKEQQAWWSVKFQLPWQPGTEPKWYIGTWIAGEIIAPLLTQNAASVKLWRVHRRAVKDASGHTFSFIFYTSTNVAEKIYADLNKHELLQQLKQKGLLQQIVLDDIRHNDKLKAEDTSDKTWPASIRKTWPYFIMGACQMWLELINDLQSEMQSAKSQEEKYQIIQNKITELWHKNGQHAWLHHLSALYGYSPLEIEF